MARKDELDEYRKLMDETIRELNRLYNVKVGQVRPALAVAGVLLMAAGLTGVMYVATVELWAHQTITVNGLAGVFAGFCVGVTGFIVAHKGLKGTWL
jgi:hypothetical protein